MVGELGKLELANWAKDGMALLCPTLGPLVETPQMKKLLTIIIGTRDNVVIRVEDLNTVKSEH